MNPTSVVTVLLLSKVMYTEGLASIEPSDFSHIAEQQIVSCLKTKWSGIWLEWQGKHIPSLNWRELELYRETIHSAIILKNYLKFNVVRQVVWYLDYITSRNVVNSTQYACYTYIPKLSHALYTALSIVQRKACPIPQC